MNPSDYRREYAAFCSALERERYKYHSGLAREARLEPIRERYADLWTKEAIEDLQRTFDSTPAYLETERAALRALTGVARIGYVEARTSEVAHELLRCESSAGVEWGGVKITAGGAPDRIADESDPTRRGDLAARWFDSIRPCDDLRAARLESLQEAARSLGFDDYRTLYAAVTGTDYEKLAASTDTFLERTASPYTSRLTLWAARNIPSGAPANLPHTDAFYFRRMAHLDPFFPARDLRGTYSATLDGLGIRVETLKNVQIDDEDRALKSARPASFAVSPPEDVRLVVAPSKGIGHYVSFFREAGGAQHYGWVSRELAARHPEFIHAPDSATRMGQALLFARLFLDPVWLGEHRGVRASEARSIASLVALREMHDVRRFCARLRYEIALNDSPDARSEQMAETYVTLHTEATGFSYSRAPRLLGTGDGFRPAAVLRAHLFAAALGEYLRMRHGHRWWAARAAGDELIDMWNTASRYSAEELARLMGVGEPDFDLLEDTLMAAMNSE